MLLGVGLFLALGLFLRDLERVKKRRWLMAAGAIGLLGITLVLGKAKFGATNWITLGGMSFQPSEIAKICYIFAGSATLERLFRRRNLALFIVLTGVCIGLLGLMSDFGTAAIFFVTFLVIAYLRSGDAATLALICGGAAFGAGIIVTVQALYSEPLRCVGPCLGGGLQLRLSADPHHVGGGLRRSVRHGRRQRLAAQRIPAGDTDLVFGMLCEEWGLVIALLAVACILTLAWFAVRASRAGPIQLLYHCRLRGRLSAGVSDLPECIRLRGSSAPHRRDLPLCVQRRLRHAVGMGAAGVSKGHGHPCGCQLCHRSGGGAEAGRGSRPYGGTGRGCL